MPSPATDAYIRANRLCSELIFPDWREFLELAYAHGDRVDAVLWWDHVHVDGQKSSLGSGGYKDPNRPGWMYAETQIYQESLGEKGLAELISYLASTIASYPNHELVPSFYLVGE